METNIHTLNTGRNIQDEIIWLQGKVLSIQEAGYQDPVIFVLAGKKSCFATVAPSCLLAPEAGDVVALCCSEDAAYITHILKKATTTANIRVNGDLNIASSEGEIRLQGKAGIRISSPGTITTTSDKLQEFSIHHDLRTETLNVSGKQMKVDAHTTQFFSRMTSIVVDDLYQRARQAVKLIENIENHTVGTLIQQVKTHLNIRSKNMVITAEEDVRIDGERIHMG